MLKQYQIKGYATGDNSNVGWLNMISHYSNITTVVKSIASEGEIGAY